MIVIHQKHEKLNVWKITTSVFLRMNVSGNKIIVGIVYYLRNKTNKKIKSQLVIFNNFMFCYT